MTVAAESAPDFSERLAFEVPTVDGPAIAGAWRPGSTDLERELPELVAAVEKRMGPIERILFNLDEWASAPHTIVSASRTIRLNGYRFQPRHTVGIRARHDVELLLVVVPPSTNDSVAQLILRSVMQPGGTETVQRLLGLELTNSAPFTDPAVAEQRWDTDGGFAGVLEEELE